MELYILLVFLAVQEAQAYDRAELRIDDNIMYLSVQDIVKAVRDSEPPWLYGYSSDPSKPIKDQSDILPKTEGNCTYFRKEWLNDTNVNFTKHEPKVPKEQKEVKEAEQPKETEKLKGNDDTITRLYGKFFNTTIKNNQGRSDFRNTKNAITVTTEPGGREGKSYKLLYSDYKDCAILRPFTLPEGGRVPNEEELSYDTTPRHCILLLSDAAARGTYNAGRQTAEVPSWMKGLSLQMPDGLPKGMPKLCQFIFRNACGDRAKLIQIFQESCPKIPNALGC